MTEPDTLGPKWKWNWLPMQAKICDVVEQHAFMARLSGILSEEDLQQESLLAVLAVAVKSLLALYGKKVESLEQIEQLFAGMISDIKEMPSE